MKLLLKKDIGRLGIIGDVVEVSAGYARNYLIPNDLATTPTAGAMKALAAERAKAEERRRQHRLQLEAAAQKLADVEITIEAVANEEGVLYGSVGPREVASALRDEGHDISSAQVELRDTIKHLDNVLVDVTLADGIEAKVKVWVVRAKGSPGEDDQAEGTEEAMENDDGTDQ